MPIVNPAYKVGVKAKTRTTAAEQHHASSACAGKHLSRRKEHLKERIKERERESSGYDCKEMGVFDSVKRATASSKLKYELVVLDRELEKEKKRMGDELYTVMFENDVGGSGGSNANSDNSASPHEHERLVVIYQACRETVTEYVEKKHLKEEELDHVEMKREEGTTTGAWLSTSASATKLKAEVAYYDREIRLRKEIFGVQVFDELGLGVTAAEEKDDSERGEDENEAKNDPVLAVLTRCVDNVRNLLQQKQAKENKILALKEHPTGITQV